MGKVSLFRWVTVGDVMVTYATGGKLPVDETWEAYLRALRAPHVRKVLGVGGPDISLTSKQRHEAAEVHRGRQLVTAMVTDSLAMRGIVTALSWLGVEIRAFPVTDLAAALSYLEVDVERRPALLRVARELATGLDAEARCEAG